MRKGAKILEGADLLPSPSPIIEELDLLPRTGPRRELKSKSKAKAKGNKLGKLGEMMVLTKKMQEKNTKKNLVVDSILKIMLS